MAARVDCSGRYALKTSFNAIALKMGPDFLGSTGLSSEAELSRRTDACVIHTLD
jgi:hypothetical protein